MNGKRKRKFVIGMMVLPSGLDTNAPHANEWWIVRSINSPSLAKPDGDDVLEIVRGGDVMAVNASNWKPVNFWEDDRIAHTGVATNSMEKEYTEGEVVIPGGRHIPTPVDPRDVANLIIGNSMAGRRTITKTMMNRSISHSTMPTMTWDFCGNAPLSNVNAAVAASNKLGKDYYAETTPGLDAQAIPGWAEEAAGKIRKLSVGETYGPTPRSLSDDEVAYVMPEHLEQGEEYAIDVRGDDGRAWVVAYFDGTHLASSRSMSAETIWTIDYPRRIIRLPRHEGSIAFKTTRVERNGTRFIGKDKLQDGESYFISVSQLRDGTDEEWMVGTWSADLRAIAVEGIYFEMDSVYRIMTLPPKRIKAMPAKEKT